MPDHWLVFEVADTGCGIAPEGLQSLFKEFVQVTAAVRLHTTVAVAAVHAELARAYYLSHLFVIFHACLCSTAACTPAGQQI